MFKYLKPYASLPAKLSVDSKSYSFVDLKKKKKAKNQHATGKAALQTFKAPVHSAQGQWGHQMGKGRHHFTKEIKTSAILGRKWEFHSKPLRLRG